MDNTFQVQNTIGKQGEALVIDALLKRGCAVEDLSSRREYQEKDIDCRVSKSGLCITLEIKNDVRSNYTGNVFIETYNINNKRRNGAGWFSYCEADYLCFVQSEKKIAHIVARAELVKKCWNNLYREVNSPFSRGYIVPITCLKHYNSYHSLELE